MAQYWGKRPLSPTDELFQLGDAARRMFSEKQSKNWTLDDLNELATIPEFPCEISGCTEKFSSILAFESHYRSVHENKCPECQHVLPSGRLLTLHVMECHDTMFQLLAEKKPMYECLVNNCDTKSKSRKERRKHMIEVHGYPTSFRFNAFMGRIKMNSKKKPKKQTVDLADRLASLSFGGRGGRGRSGMMGRRGRGRSSQKKSCFNCGSIGHMKKDCPNGKKKTSHPSSQGAQSSMDIN
eukprot:m.111632 g.111632  ORF g.111632 m.111632 type:complete len:239 (+) comp14065_c0_seq1:271-987(+)